MEMLKERAAATKKASEELLAKMKHPKPAEEAPVHK